MLDNLLHARGSFPDLGAWLILLIPVLIILVCASGSLLLASVVLRGGRPRWRSIGVALGLVALLDVGGCLLLWPQLSPRHPAPLADWTLPGLQRLRTAGLVSYPDAQQPTGPVRVDYLAVDSGDMYVAYTIPDSLHSRTDWDLQLFDDHGKEYVGLGDGGSGVGTLEQLMPWRPAVHAYNRFQGLPPTARTAVVRLTVFGSDMHTSFAMPVVTTTAETVHLSLHLQGLTRVRSRASARHFHRPRDQPEHRRALKRLRRCFLDLSHLGPGAVARLGRQSCHAHRPGWASDRAVAGERRVHGGVRRERALHDHAVLCTPAARQPHCADAAEPLGVLAAAHHPPGRTLVADARYAVGTGTGAARADRRAPWRSRV